MNIIEHFPPLAGAGGGNVNAFILPSKFYKVCLSLFICILIISGCNNSTNDSESSNFIPEKITIATAANMQFVMKELTQAFTDTSGIDCEIVVGSSGNLTAQISEGAPYNVFVAADMKYPNLLYEKGLAKAPPINFASGNLVLWSVMDNVNPSLDNLTTDQIKHIAIANPKLAPYGTAAIQVLQHHDLLDKVRHKLVYGESIAQTNQFITSGSAEVGFTAMSVVLSPKMKDEGQWKELDPKTYSPIDQGVIIIKHKNTSNLINIGPQKFYEFLLSEKAKKILKHFGYWTNE